MVIGCADGEQCCRRGVGKGGQEKSARIGKNIKSQWVECWGEQSCSLICSELQFVDYDESACIVRAPVDVSYLDPVTAKVWGINPQKAIILELKFHLEDERRVLFGLLFNSRSASSVFSVSVFRSKP